MRKVAVKEEARIEKIQGIGVLIRSSCSKSRAVFDPAFTLLQQEPLRDKTLLERPGLESSCQYCDWKTVIVSDPLPSAVLKLIFAVRLAPVRFGATVMFTCVLAPVPLAGSTWHQGWLLDAVHLRDTEMSLDLC